MVADHRVQQLLSPPPERQLRVLGKELVAGAPPDDGGNADPSSPDRNPWRTMPTYAVAHLRNVTMGPQIIEYLQRIDATL